MMVASAGALAELAALRAKAARQERELQQPRSRWRGWRNRSRR